MAGAVKEAEYEPLATAWLETLRELDDAAEKP